LSAKSQFILGFAMGEKTNGYTMNMRVAGYVFAAG
jgi:hypothetical protein